jgi:hypothetical protein
VETPSPYDVTRSLAAHSESRHVRLEIKSMEIVPLLTKCREISDDELELIEMRYRRALAIASLEDLFAQGLLDCT